MLTLFVPVIKKEVGRLAILLQSLKHFMEPGGMKILILTPASHLKEVSEAVRKLPKPDVEIKFLTDEEVYPYDRKSTTGWERQQALKLLVSRHIDTDFYLIFDCDVFATKRFAERDLVQNNKAIMDLQEKPSGFQDISMVAEMIGMEPKQKDIEVMKVTPALLSTHITRNLLNHLKKKHCQNTPISLPEYLYKSLAINQDEALERVTEYMLYYLYALHSGELWKRHYKGLLICNHNVWYPEECFEWDPSKVFSDQGYFCVYQGNFRVPATIVFDQIRDYIGAPRDGHVPKISCLMVTKDRLPLVKTAVGCFQNQTYPNKELVVVCDAPDGVKEYVESLKDSRIVLFQLPPKSKTLGELRNFSIDKATGELITQWDDDDWYHPSRLSIQYNRLKDRKVDACLMSQWLMAWPGAGRYAISNARKDGWEGTMLAKKTVVPRYSNLRKFEDTEMMKRLFRTAKVHIMNDPDYYFLYVYLVHGNNTWDKEHFRTMFDYGSPIDREWPHSSDKLSKKLSELVGMTYEGYTFVPTHQEQVSSTISLVVLLLLFVGVWYLLMR